MKDIAKAVTYTGIFAIPFIVLIISNTLFFPYITGKNFTFRILVEIVFSYVGPKNLSKNDIITAYFKNFCSMAKTQFT